MFCGTSKTKAPSEDGHKLVKELEKVRNNKIKVELVNGSLVYKNNTATWNHRFQNDFSHMTEEQRKEHKKGLEMQLQKKTEELNELERRFLAKLAKICLMMQMHCNIKRRTTQAFKEYGIDVRELEQYEGDDNYYNEHNDN